MAVAQAIALLTLPLLTRLYSAEAFGVLAVYTSVVGVASIGASLRYEFAIPRAASDRTALGLVQLGVALATTTSLICATLVLAYRARVGQILENGSASVVAWLIPLGLLLVGYYQVLSYWAIRKRAYRVVARTRVEQGLGRVVVQLIGGLVAPTPIPLVVGEMIGRAAGSVRLSRLLSRRDLRTICSTASKDAIALAKRYSAFPMYSLPSSVVAVGMHQVMPIVMLAVHGVAAAGVFGLAQRVLQSPINFLNGTVSQAYYGEAVRLYREDTVAFANLYRQTVRRLFLVGVVPTLLIVLAAEPAFKLIFGPEWADAGRMGALLAPAILFQAMSSPVSQSLVIIDRQRLHLSLDMVRALVLGVGIGLAWHFHLSAAATVAVYAVAMTMLYATNLLVFDRAVRTSIRQHAGEEAVRFFE